MATKKIQLKTLSAATAAVLLLEVIGNRIILPDPGNYLKIGIIRLLDIGCILTTVLSIEKDLFCIGLHRAGVVRALMKGALWSAGFGLIAAFGAGLLILFGISPMQLIRVRLPADLFSRCLLFMVGGIVGPIAEEFFFRGLIFRFLRQWGLFFALLFSSLLFAVLHPMASGLPIIQLIGGLIFAISFEMEKHLLVPTIIHILGNLAIFSFSLFTF